METPVNTSSPLGTPLITPQATPKRPNSGQAQYMVQEQDYLHKLKSSIAADYSPNNNLSSNDASDQESDHPSSSSDLEETDSSLNTADLPFDVGLNTKTDSKQFRERTEWQAMLASVLTGEVFTSEKSRLERTQPQNIDEELRWLELKAKVTGRSVFEQRKLVNLGRSTSHEVLERIMQFKLDNTYDNIEEPFNIVGDMLQKLYLCESMWPNRKALKTYLPLYASPEFEARVNALTAWYTVKDSILRELEELRKWTGNVEADPTLMPSDPPYGNTQRDVEFRVPLVDVIWKEEEFLTSIFRNRVQRCLFPLVERSRECTIEYADQFVQMGLPLFLFGLNPIVAFPVRIMREVIELRLTAFNVNNPSMVMIDEAIKRFQTYMSLCLMLTEEYMKVTQPVLDKGWILANAEGATINKLMLRCIRFYLDLLSNKFLDGGHTTISFFRSFKSIEQLELHFKFLQESCRLIDGGDISVAEKFTSLHARVLSRLLAYWEHQIEGPPRLTSFDIDRWYASTIENIRSIQRKLLRFYKILSDTYENACDFKIPQGKTLQFLMDLENNGFALVFIDSIENWGCYTFVSPNLKNRRDVMKKMLHGHSRPPSASSANTSSTSSTASSSSSSQTPNNSSSPQLPGAIVHLTVTEALNWSGEVVNLNIDTDLPEFHGGVRLIAEGGFKELQMLKTRYPMFETLHVTTPRISHLEKVDNELRKMRAITFKLAMSVIQSAIVFRKRIIDYGCLDTIQAMFGFAKEFGQRSIPLVTEGKRERIVLKLFELCVCWIEFVSDDCPASDNKTFKWTVQALDFVMLMTKGVNILVVNEEQFDKLRRKVADCVTLLISHFDIMGARSKAQNLTNYQNRTKNLRLNQRHKLLPINALEDEDVVVATNRQSTLDKLGQLENKLAMKYNKGKILDKHNTEFEFLSFASSPLAASSMRWQRGQPIGSGAFGSVFKARNLDNFQIMAVKEVRISSSKSISKVLNGIKDEMTVLEMVSHPNIVKYYGVEIHRERVYIFMEYCTNGSLAHLLQDGGIQDEGIIQFFSLQILEGVAYLHESGIVHRDIKPENILLKGSFIKIVDFGAAKVIANPATTSNQNNLDALKGTPMYMAPEVIKSEPTAKLPSVDIWSIGCVILQMVTGQEPWPEYDNVYSIMYCIGGDMRPTIPSPDEVNPQCVNILERTLEVDPMKRPSALELLKDSWFDFARQTFSEIAAANEAGELDMFPEYTLSNYDE